MMKYAIGDIVKIIGGSRPELLGVHGFIFDATKKTVWIQLAEGSLKGSVILKRNMKDLTKAADAKGDILSTHHGKPNGCDLFIAMPRNHQHSKEEIKEAFVDLGWMPQAVHILPLSRNCLVHFTDSSMVNDFIKNKKSMVIGVHLCRIGRYYCSQAPGGGPKPNNNKRTSPANSRATALLEATNKRVKYHKY